MARILLLAALFVSLLATATSAQFGTDENQPLGPATTTQNAAPPMSATQMEVQPATVTGTDPDHTGYPFINNWKGGLNKDVNVFLNNEERTNLTQARVDETNSMQPIFTGHANAIRSILTANQITDFNEIVSHWDMEVMAGWTDNDWLVYNAYLSQRLNLSASQEQALTTINQQLVADITPVRAQYASRFDTVIAAAEQRVAARSTTIGTEK